MGQVFIANGTTTVTEVGRQATEGNTTINVTGGAGNFTIYRAQGVVATVTSGSAAVTGSVVTLSAGANTITVDGNGTCTLNLTIGTAANWNSVESWSAASGGTGGASVPTSSDNVYFDANSFTGASQVVTVDAGANCLDMDWTGATNTPILSNLNGIYIFGSLTLGAMSITASVGVVFSSTSTGRTVTTNGVDIGIFYFNGVGGGWTLQDAFTSGAYGALQAGTLNTNGQTVTTASTFDAGNGAGVKVLTLGSSIVNCAFLEYPGSNLTLTANTATINCSGNFAGGGITTYNIVNLTGATSTISGSNTFAELNLASGTTQTITFTDGTTQTVTDADLGGSAGHVHTLVGTAAAGWAISKASGRLLGAYLDLSYSTATGGAAFYARNNSVNTVGNTGWMFREPVGVYK